jgi:hypothetical protein
MVLLVVAYVGKNARDKKVWGKFVTPTLLQMLKYLGPKR